MPAPTVASLTPTFGPTAGGNNVVIAGTNFVAVISIAFGGVEAEVWSTEGDEITVTAPPHAGGIVQVIVTTEDGSSG